MENAAYRGMDVPRLALFCEGESKTREAVRVKEQAQNEFGSFV
jgi:hypothetical protein